MYVYTFGTPDGARHESATFFGIERQRETFFRKTGRRPAIHRYRIGTHGQQVSGCETLGSSIGRQRQWIGCQPGFSNRIVSSR